MPKYLKPALYFVVIVLIISASIIFLNKKTSDSTEKANRGTENLNAGNPAGETSELTDLETDNGSGYVEYTQNVLEESGGERRVLFFYANWCPTCVPTDADLKKNVNLIPSDVTVIRVNYKDTETSDEEKQLARKYGITYQHTFVQIDQEGKEVTKWNGGETEELLENLKQ